MRYLYLAPLALTGFFFLGQAPAHATEYPYCMTYASGWSGAIEQCDYSTMAQCQASTGGLNGSCAPNWRLAFRRGAAAYRVEVEPATTSSKRNRR